MPLWGPNEVAATLTPPMPMDVCGAESQSQIGYMLEQCLINHLHRVKQKVPACSLLTETIVDSSDPAFANPSKPMGPFYTEERAKQLALESGFVMREDAGRGWRRVVPSPNPREIVQAPVIADLTHQGVLVICNGGGGIPVVRDLRGALCGVDAVIDKDLSAERLAVSLAADVLLMLTDVEQVYIHYQMAEQKALGKVNVDEMGRYQAEGHFKAGSMEPKVEACVRFRSPVPAELGSLPTFSTSRARYEARRVPGSHLQLGRRQREKRLRAASSIDERKHGPRAARRSSRRWIQCLAILP
jgi:carbamate kinase